MRDERLREDAKQLLRVAYERRVVDGVERMQVDLAAAAGITPVLRSSGSVFAVDGVCATYDELLTKNAPFDFPPREMTPVGCKRWFRDPDGNGFVIASR